jgi:hypothetical protein
MLVYANELYLKSEDDGLDRLKGAIKEWLCGQSKIGSAFSSMKIIPFAKPFTYQHPQTGLNEVTIFGTPDGAPDYCLSINYRHNDSRISGRAWFTRIGIERPGPIDPLRVTFVLETSEISPQVAAHPVTPSMPGIIHKILELCEIHESTPGSSLRILTSENAEKFQEIIADPARNYTIIVVSPDDFTEEPSVEVSEIQERLVGLAQVYLIQDKRESWRLREILPSYHTAWDGSLTQISPGRSGQAIGRVYRRGEIEAICEDNKLTFERHLFNELTHRYNLAKSRRHISSDVVSRRLVEFKLAKLREQLTGVDGFEELVSSYEEDRDKARKHAEELEFKLLATEEANERLEEEKEGLEKQVRTLHFHLNQARNHSSTTTSNSSIEAPEPIPASLNEIADRISTSLIDKLILTNHAKKTLNHSPFEDVARVWEIITLLASTFHATFTNELRMQDAIAELQELGGRYAGNQSEITAGKNSGYERIYNGKKYMLKKHIGIGTTRDPRYCFRIYFEWEQEENKIVILHAGEHLDTQST